MAESLQITRQETPNPNALKWTLNRVMAAQGTTYREGVVASAPWAQALLRIPGIIQVFALNNFLSISKTPEADWDTLVPQVEQVLRQTFRA